MTDDPQGKFNFDPDESRRRKEEGRSRAALSRQELLEVARDYATKIARERGEVTADDYFLAMLRDGHDPTRLGPAAGSVFRVGFVFTGKWRRSARVSNHSSDLRIWKLDSNRVAG